MTIQEQEQAKKLLNATIDIITKCEESNVVMDVMSATAVWDGVECDGHCLLEEIKDLIWSLERTKN